MPGYCCPIAAFPVSTCAVSNPKATAAGVGIPLVKSNAPLSRRPASLGYELSIPMNIRGKIVSLN